MTRYDDYIRAVSELVTGPLRAETAAGLNAEQRRRGVDRLESDVQAAVARHTRMRQEVTRQLGIASQALQSHGHDDLLALQPQSDPVEHATEQDVTSAVQVLQHRVAELVAAASRARPRPVLQPASRPRRRPVAIALVLAVVLVAVALLVHALVEGWPHLLPAAPAHPPRAGSRVLPEENMSQLNQLKQQIDQLGQQARSQAQGLAAFKPKFSQAVGQVGAVIGGSAQRVDQDMIATLQAAEKQVDEAVRALQAAASAAGRYAASL